MCSGRESGVRGRREREGERIEEEEVAGRWSPEKRLLGRTNVT